MSIPVCYITQYGQVIGTVEYVGNHTFIDNRRNYSTNRILPSQDLVSCEVVNNNCICTVVGRDNRHYIVCFGDNYLYRLSRDAISNYIISNAKQTQGGNLIIVDKVRDIGKLFPDKGIIFERQFIGEHITSLGMARKFFARYDNRECIVKFSKRSDNRDLKNEVKYYAIAKILNIDCCRVVYSRYDGRDCCISIFEYNRKLIIKKRIYRNEFQYKKIISKIIKYKIIF